FVLTGVLTQSPEVPKVPIIQLLRTFNYPNTKNQTQPQKINNNFDIIKIFVNPNEISHNFVIFKNENFNIPIVNPNDTGNLTKTRKINNSHLIYDDYLNSANAFEKFFLSNNVFTNYAPEP